MALERIVEHGAGEAQHQPGPPGLLHLGLGVDPLLAGGLGPEPLRPLLDPALGVAELRIGVLRLLFGTLVLLRQRGEFSPGEIGVEIPEVVTRLRLGQTIGLFGELRPQGREFGCGLVAFGELDLQGAEIRAGRQGGGDPVAGEARLRRDRRRPVVPRLRL